MNSLSYTTVDVFTSTRFEGNPLAVMSDARGVSDATMQKIAAEFGYSEVTFVLPPEKPENTARVRIFAIVRSKGFSASCMSAVQRAEMRLMR